MIRWLRRHPITIAYLLIVAVAAIAIYGVRHEAEERRAALCHTVNDQQAVLSDLLEVVLAGDGGGGLPLTALPSFAELDSDTQDYLRELEAASSREDPDDLDDRLRAFAEERLIPADCTRARK